MRKIEAIIKPFKLDEMKEAILDAALRLFSENGFDGVSMRAVAREAGVSKSNIYHHFESKEALYLAIVKASAESLSEMVEALAEGAGEFDARLRKFTRAHLAHLFDQAATVRLFLRELFSEETRLQKLLVEQVIGGIFERMISIFAKGQEAGLLRDRAHRATELRQLRQPHLGDEAAHLEVAAMHLQQQGSIIGNGIFIVFQMGAIGGADLF